MMRIRHKRSFAIGLLLALISFALDQLSKWAVLGQAMESGQFHYEITSFFNLSLVWNRGVSFGLFAAQKQPLVLTGISTIIVIILLAWLARNRSLLVASALGLVMGGAVGNVIDRLRQGAVTDFLDFHIAGYHWPAFNIADSAIFIGVVLLCFHSMFIEQRKPEGTSQ